MSPKYQVQRPEIFSSTDMKTHLDEDKITTENQHECCNGGGRQNTTTLSPFLLLHCTETAAQWSTEQLHTSFASAPQHWTNHNNFTRTNPYLTSNTLLSCPIAVPQSVFLGYLCDVVPHPFHWEARRKFLFTSYWEQRKGILGQNVQLWSSSVFTKVMVIKQNNVFIRIPAG